MYNLRPDFLGFLPVPFFGSFFFFLPSAILSATILNTSSVSSSDNSLGTNFANLSSETLEAFLAAVPDTPPAVIIVRSSKFGYLEIEDVRDVISLKSSSLPSLAPITHNTSLVGWFLAKLYTALIGGIEVGSILTLNGR